MNLGNVKCIQICQPCREENSNMCYKLTDKYNNHIDEIDPDYDLNMADAQADAIEFNGQDHYKQWRV